jgi:hypothetical protein
MTRRHQAAKFKKNHAQGEPAKTKLSGLGYWSIWFFPEEIESN